MFYVHPVIRRFGLGNKLLVWARAEAFAVDHGAKILMPSFTQLPSIGAILRGERMWRTNWGNFDLADADYVRGLKRWRTLKYLPKVSEDDWTEQFQDGVVVMDGIGHDSFTAVLKHHSYICDRLRIITKPSILRAVDELAREPFIGVHIRRGDFKQAGVLTEDAWYVAAIQKTIESVGHLPIRIFSDGKPKELDFVRKALPNERVIIMPAAKPMQDIWALSKSKILVGSSRSSFSIWAVLLGQMPSIWARKNAPSARDLYVGGGKMEGWKVGELEGLTVRNLKGVI